MLRSRQDGKEPMMVKNTSKPGTTIIEPETDEPLTEQEARRERFWQTVDQIRERNADKDPDAELAFITEVVEEVRREQHEREQTRARVGH
jgi:hypothetical protein